MSQADTGYRILLVEDDPDDREQIRITLRRAKTGRFEVIECTSIQEAMTRLAETRVDLIALDLSLPDGEGEDTFAQVRAAAPDLPIVVMTGSDDIKLALRLIHRGAQDYLIKFDVSPTNLVRCFQLAIERKQLEQEFEAARLAALEALHMKSAFVAMISHEIRTPLNAILGMAELLLGSPLNRDQREYVEIFQRAGRGLLDVLNNALELSKLESGKCEISPAPFDLHEVIEETLDVFAFIAHKKEIELAVEVDPNLPARVVGDSARLRQVLTNLIGNAVKFTDQGGVTLRVGAPTRAEQCFHFEVLDTGRGIPEEALERIFERFEQADRTARGAMGTGLGLTLCRELLERMGGSIRAANRPEGGSCFSFALPLEAQADRHDAGVGFDTLQGLRVLVVDDSRLVRDTCASVLTRAGSHVEAVATIAEARDALGRGGFDRVVLDSRMPDGGAFELLSQFGQGEAFPERPVITLMMDHRAGDLERCREFGAIPVLKPLSPGRLARALAGRGVVRVGQERQRRRSDVSLPLRVLLAEDGIDNQVLIQAFLRNTGASVRVVENGREALEAATREPFDAVLMDVSMPELDGLEATRRIRAWERHIGRPPVPIIALTAHAFTEDAERSAKAGCDAHLTKPVSRTALVDALRLYAPAKATLEEASPDPEIADLVPTYLANRRADLERLRAALAQQDFGTVRTLGHRMKGSGAGYGFPRISELGAWIEVAGKERSGRDAEQAVSSLSSYLDEVVVPAPPAAPGTTPHAP